VTAAEAIVLLAKLPAATPICFADGEALYVVKRIELIQATADDYGFVATVDGARDDALKVAVVS